MSILFARWRIIGAALVLIASICTGVQAADGITLQVTDVPLRNVISLLTQQSGCNIILADDSRLDKRITANLKDISLDQALDRVVKAAGVGYKKDADGIYVVGGPANMDPVIKASDIVKETPVKVETKQVTAEPAVVKDSIFTKVKLAYAKPSEIIDLLTTDSRTVNRIQKEMGRKYKRFNMHRVNDYPAIPASDGKVDDTAAGRTATSVDGAGQIGGTGGGYNRGSSTGTRGGFGSTGQYGSSSTTGGQGGQGGFGTSGDMFVPDGIEDVRAFDPDNSLLIKGDEDAIQKFKEILRLLDVAPQQVEIKAEFIQVSTSEAKKMGIDWSLERLNSSFSTEFNPTGNVTYGFSAGNIAAQLKAELTQSVGRLINSPIVSTTNNNTAYISIGKSIPYWESSQTTTNGTTAQTYSVNFIDIDTTLEVTPRINGDDSITMYLLPSVSGQGVDYKGPDGTVIPEETTQDLETERRVMNGETIVVGGLITKNENSGSQKVPILADLPFIGSLFRSEDTKNIETELLIFITPTIIRDKTSTAAGSTSVVNP